MSWAWLLLLPIVAFAFYECIHPTRWRWYRRWKGGKWALWQTSLPMSAVWLNQWERPGCGEYMILKEDWGSRDH